MSGVQGHVLGHLVRRGVAHFAGPNADIMGQLQQEANLYDESNPEMKFEPRELLPVLITGAFCLFLIASIRYTVGEVIASLAMIESPTTTAIIEDKPPAYADEPDATLEKEIKMPAEAEADIEVLLVKNKPITTNIRATVGHLHRVGGFGARWRGLGWSIVYHGFHAGMTNFFAHMLGFGVLGRALVYVIASVALARLHMLWTHSMILAPTSKRFWKRMVPHKQCKAILLPSLVFALAQQATLMIPLAIASSFGGINHMSDERRTQCAVVASRALAVVASLFLTAFCLLLPASVTLTRIEAALLPEGEETIVPFDRQAIVGDIDVTVRGGCRALFLQAWRSFDCSARWRLIKLYLKMVAMQFAIAFVGIHVMAAEVYIIAGDRLAILARSAVAQLQLAVIEAHQNAN